MTRFRELARRDPLAYENDFGLALYALCQETRKRPGPITQTFIDLCEEGIALHRRLLHTNPASRPQLTTLLVWLGVAQHSLGHHGKARPLFAESLDLARGSARRDPHLYEPELCRALALASFALSSSGDHHEALRAADDAVSRWRRLAAEQPDIHDAELAVALHTRCFAHQSAGNQQKMLEPAEESVRIVRRLHSTGTPSALASEMATGLDLVTAALLADDRWSEALPVAQESITWHGTKQNAEQGGRSLGLASSLGVYSMLLDKTGHRSEAKHYAQEAYVECLRRIRDTDAVADLAPVADQIGALLSGHGMKWSASMLRKGVAARLDTRRRGLRRFLRR
ncbi:hypothetical protein [Streptomyces tsukubensis]|uniref:Tetratricopeptide repeat protein n=1 Tax=Streptomyces tsukubensis TaxID=83656 RepID=A0A1V4A8X2_9ACTN|nr:hypothetical protein [Streptomyces tsukubensis]OON79613.1 hypothetical protein B1H18_13620 [Streptomyces tsukubensis]QFR95797.1 hypothetical protein GBW32_25645 [Streptomyces tsukubensis]